MSDYTPGASLITCTGGRPQAFARCQHFVSRQTYRGPVQWIIVDDVEPHMCPPAVPSNVLVTRIFPKPKWEPGKNTLPRNMMAAIPEVQHPMVLVIEDDDRYSPDYIAAMVEALENADIAGERFARYYHIPRRMYFLCPNNAHASLCATGFRRELLPLLAKVCGENKSPYIDIHLWREAHHSRKAMLDTARVIGIKGLPGRPGIGMGHRPDYGRTPNERRDHLREWTADPDASVLRQWIGDDVQLYEEFFL